MFLSSVLYNWIIMQSLDNPELQAFPFFKKENLTKEAFITLSNNPNEAPMEMTPQEMRQHVL